MTTGHLDHLGELRIALAAAADIAGIDAVLSERFGAGRMGLQQFVAVEVEITDQRHRDPALGEAVADVRHRCGGLLGIDRDAYDLGAGTGERTHLRNGGIDVRGVSVGHRLHDDRRIATDLHAADETLDAATPPNHLACSEVVCWATIQARMRGPMTSSGTAPVASSMSWKARISKRGPSVVSASRRSAEMRSWPIL